MIRSALVAPSLAMTRVTVPFLGGLATYLAREEWATEFFSVDAPHVPIGHPLEWLPRFHGCGLLSETERRKASRPTAGCTSRIGSCTSSRRALGVAGQGTF